MERIHQFNFEPPARQEEHARVTRWAEAIIAKGLSLCFAQGETKAEQELSRTSEVLRGIARYLVSHYIVRENESMLRRASRTTFALKGKVKVTSSLFQGRKYIASVSDGQEQPQPCNSSELFALDSGETAHVIHIAENHLGVVNLVVTNLGHVLQAEQVAGIWWRAIYIPCGRCLIMATHDTADDTASIYTPLDDNEAITEIWWGMIGGNSDAMGLTSDQQGREVFLGFVGALPDHDWELASTPAISSYRFYYESLSSIGIGGLAFEDPSPVTQGVPPFDPTTIVPPMPDFRVSLKSQSAKFKTFVGSVTYTNGHKEALGEDQIWLRFEYDPTGIIDENPRLVEISFSRIEPTIRDGTDPAIAGINRLEVLSADELHWWWSSLQCQVSYEGQGRLQPRDAEKWLLFDD
ncbi:hypothetical protein FANTH_1101 [Fusarium anthophilum]|uniref:Uncharacterized protein n=1 Tax=Fusarium anthophilum TaxID=48485 RepID=A0A8H4ZWE1_9HYPO|nr:hypothetical protein FANTH_1101 [Fusarium anthophilum]